MAGSTSKSTWKAMEREIATAWGTFRNPLSGANNRQANGDGRPGDIILDDYDALVEAKYRASFMHHTLFRAAQADAKKHRISAKNVILYTKVKREHGQLVVMDAELFHEYCLPHLQPILKGPRAAKTIGLSLRDGDDPPASKPVKRPSRPKKSEDSIRRDSTRKAKETKTEEKPRQASPKGKTSRSS